MIAPTCHTVGPDIYDMRLGDRVVGRVERRDDAPSAPWRWKGITGSGGREKTLDLAVRAWEHDWARFTRHARFGQAADGSAVIELGGLPR